MLHLSTLGDIQQSLSQQLSKQLAECMAIIKRKDEEIATLQQEITSYSFSKSNLPILMC